MPTRSRRTFLFFCSVFPSLKGPSIHMPRFVLTQLFEYRHPPSFFNFCLLHPESISVIYDVFFLIFFFFLNLPPPPPPSLSILNLSLFAPLLMRTHHGRFLLSLLHLPFEMYGSCHPYCPLLRFNAYFVPRIVLWFFPVPTQGERLKVLESFLFGVCFVAVW